MKRWLTADSNGGQARPLTRSFPFALRRSHLMLSLSLLPSFPFSLSYTSSKDQRPDHVGDAVGRISARAAGKAFRISMLARGL